MICKTLQHVVTIIVSVTLLLSHVLTVFAQSPNYTENSDSAGTPNQVYLPIITRGGNEITKKPTYVPDRLVVKFKSSISSEASSLLATTYGVTSVSAVPETGGNVWQFAQGTNLDTIRTKLASDPAIEYAEPDYY